MGTITSDLTTLTACDTATDGGTWGRVAGSSSANPFVDADSKIQGAASMAAKLSSSTLAAAGLYIPLTSTFNSSGKALFLWVGMNTASNMEKCGGSGVMFLATSDTGSGTAFSSITNCKLWKIDGSDVTTVGGWNNQVIDLSRPAHLVMGSGISDLTAVKTLYLLGVQLTSVLSATLGIEIDNISLGTGITAILGDVFTPLTIEELAIADYASSWGVVTRTTGGYAANGKVNIGLNTASQTAETIFKDTGGSLIWKPYNVAVTFNELVLAGYSTGPQKTVFQLGDYNPATGLASNGYTIKGVTSAGTMLSANSGLRNSVQALYTGSVIGASQAFKNVGVGNIVDKLTFWMLKTGTPPGTIVAKIYAGSGTLYTKEITGGNYIPTGTALATSDTVTATTLTTGYTWITFNFSGANNILLSDDTVYEMTVEYSDAGSGVANSVSVGLVANNVSVYGNLALLTGSTWTDYANNDVVCEMYVTRFPAVWTLTASDSNALIKLYNSTFQHVYRATLNSNTRSFAVSGCSASASTTMTTTGSYLTDAVVGGMKITGTGITGDVYVVSVQSATSLTVSTPITVSSASITFADKSEIINSAFKDFGEITTNGCPITNSVFQNVVTTAPISATYGLSASAGANANVITGCSFASAGTGHGLMITGTAADTTLTNNSWSGFAASSGSTGNEAVFVNIATGIMNLNITGGTIPSVRTAGCTVTVVSGARDVTVTAQTALGAGIGSAFINLECATGGGAGSLPYNVTVTIVNSGTLATVTHSAHLLATGDKVVIRAASHNANNGVFAITKIDANSYSYTMLSTPGSNPTGTIKSTFVLLYGVANAGGVLSMSRVFPVTQPVTGWARKMSASPFYKEGPINTTVSSSANTNITATLVSDE